MLATAEEMENVVFSGPFPFLHCALPKSVLHMGVGVGVEGVLLKDKNTETVGNMLKLDLIFSF